MQVGLAGGCEEIIVPELDMNLDIVCSEIQEGNRKGKVSWIIIVAEGKAKAHDLAEIITNKTGLETRVAVLGHIQRGGRPTSTDRILGARLGNYAVEVLKKGVSDHCVYLKNNSLETIPLDNAIQVKQIDVEDLYRLIKILT